METQVATPDQAPKSPPPKGSRKPKQNLSTKAKQEKRSKHQAHQADQAKTKANRRKRKNANARAKQAKITARISNSKTYIHPLYGLMVEIAKNCWVQQHLIGKGAW